ncbi:MAG TPA: hypothetical protein VF403_17555 [Kofleriaceae bacterium]
MKTQIEMLLEDALEILDHAELTSIEGGYIWGPGCPGYPGTDDPFAPFGPPANPFPIGPIVLC